ncbi:unnamed protein product [Xylocopa violacea]|uniref:Uncharacterized protein n=1 Tax=Xylocopa violacea TaxID=135666 RepID=A0ABP1NRE1_XYLVO
MHYHEEEFQNQQSLRNVTLIIPDPTISQIHSYHQIVHKIRDSEANEYSSPNWRFSGSKKKKEKKKNKKNRGGGGCIRQGQLLHRWPSSAIKIVPKAGSHTGWCSLENCKFLQIRLIEFKLDFGDDTLCG